MLALLLILLAPPAPDVYAADTVTRLMSVHGYDAPKRDTVLIDAARELAAHHVEAGPKSAQQAATTLRFVLAKHSIADTHVVPFTLRHTTLDELEDRLPSVVARIEPRLAPTHIGASSRVDGEVTWTTVLLVHRGIQLAAPLPRRLDPGETLSLRGPLLPGYFKPRVLVSPPGAAEVQEYAAGTGERSVNAVVRFDGGPGAYDVEIVADSPQGPVVLINQRIYAGVRPPSRAEPLPTAVAKGQPEHALFNLINAARKSAGMNALRWHPQLASEAKTHAAEMAAAKSLRHVSPERGPLTARLKALGMKTTGVAENLALADTPTAAMNAFLNSPGHKRNLFTRPLTHVGIGVSGRYFAVAMARLPF